MKLTLSFLLFFTSFFVNLQAQCTLDATDQQASDVITCLSACACQEVIIPDGVTVALDGDWDLTSQGDITIRIQGNGGLELSGNGVNAEAIILSMGSTIIIEDTDNSNALAQTGGNGQVRIVIGTSEYDGNDFSIIVANGGVNASGVLPIVLLDQNLGIQEEGVQVSWRTVYELDNHHYEVWRGTSLNEMGKLAQIEAQSPINYPLEYQYLDSKPEIGINYYQLIQVDIDGDRQVFPPMAIQYQNTDWQLFPNPIQHSFSIQGLASSPDSVLELSFFDLQGHLKKSCSHSGDLSHIPLEGLIPGYYLLKAQMGNQRKVFKVYYKP